MTKVPENLLSLALNTPKVSSAVVCANQMSVLESVKEATEINLIQPILIGDKKWQYKKYQKKGLLNMILIIQTTQLKGCRHGLVLIKIQIF